jgi:VWFA-related protein
MKRRLAALLTCALIAFGQRSRNPEPPSSPAVSFVDLIALDASGHPVTDLSAADFELRQSGQPRKISQSAWFDTRLHTARGTESLPLELAPDEIRRNFVAIVDDLGLNASGLAASRDTLRAFVQDQMAAGDRMAVLRVSAGSGDLEQFTGDRRVLEAALDRIQFLGGNVSPQAASGATRLAVHFAVSGLQRLPGRKFVVVFTPNLHASALDVPVSSLALEADTAMTTIYAVDPGTPSVAPFLRETGGAAAASLAQILPLEDGYYVLGFEDPSAGSDLRAHEDSVAVSVRRPGVTLRVRSHVASAPSREDFSAPDDRAVQIRRALSSPFDSGGIRTRLTAGFAGYNGPKATVDISVGIDAAHIAFVRDLKGVSRGSVQLTIEAISESAAVQRFERAYGLAIPPTDFPHAVHDGLVYLVSIPLPSFGQWQIRAVVADGVSDHIGSAVQWVEVPPPHDFSMSSLTLRSLAPVAAKDPPLEPGENEIVRVFRTGRTMQVLYSVFNPHAGDDKQYRFDVTARVYAQGHLIFAGSPSRITYPVAEGTSRLVNARLAFGTDIGPGAYIMEVSVTDQAAPPGAPRTLSRFIDFQLRP